MKNAVLALREKPPGLIVDIRGLKGFSAHQIVDNLKKTWPDLRSAHIAFPDSGHLGEIYPEYMARSLEAGICRKKLAAAILPHVQNAQIVGVPAILGIHRSLEVQADLEALIGVKIFEIPTLPPSVPGLRLKEMFEKALPEKGVRQFLQQRVTAVLPEPDNGFLLDIAGGYEQGQKIRCKGILLATGRFFGKGLTADRKRIRESLFDLPVFQPASRSNWYLMDFLDPKGHPIHQAGLEIDEDFRPLSASGSPRVFKPLCRGLHPGASGLDTPEMRVRTCHCHGVWRGFFFYQAWAIAERARQSALSGLARYRPRASTHPASHFVPAWR